MENRKKEHIEMTFQSQVEASKQDPRFYYEPFLSAHPSNEKKQIPFLGKTLHNPLWISSLTGGTNNAKLINTNLAKACNEFGLGMGLGSCRVLLEDKKHLPDFDMRKIIGDNLPFYANLGIAQIEHSIKNQEVEKITELVKMLNADGLIIHVNPLQEWFQPEGDRFLNPPIDTIKRFIDKVDFPIIVKEVGQGFGPQSIKELLMLPLSAIEFGALGGTNFSKLELMRTNQPSNNSYNVISKIGHSANDMIGFLNQAMEEIKNPACKNIIVSGGIKSFLDGYYLTNKIQLKSIYGQASEFLKHAQGDYSTLQNYISNQIEGLKLAESFLRIR